jgi:transposase
MGQAFSDDRRRRIAAAGERGEGSCRVLARRFGVSWEYVRKARQQPRKNGCIEHLPQSRYGVPSRMTEPFKAHMLALVEAQADIRIDELREKIATELGVRASWSSVQRWVKELRLRLKIVAPRHRAGHGSEPRTARRVRRAYRRNLARTSDLLKQERHHDPIDQAPRRFA